MKRLLSGLRTSGVTHLGNYFGAIRQWVLMQQDYESFTFIADLHGLTTPFQPGEIKEKTLETAKLYVALGLDPKKTTIFVQSHLEEHSELAWILSTVAHMGELSRMTQFKEKSEGQESINLGLFAYPVLMAADILLYQADVVPVGEDQKQHVELTRDLAQRFNSRFGETFKVPEPIIQKGSARIMGLDNPEKKMSKSAESVNNYIGLLDSPEVIRDKVKAAVTDSGREIKFDPHSKPAVSNLLNIYSLAAGQDIKQIEAVFAGKSYGEFKQELAEELVRLLTPIQEKFHDLSDRTITKILKDGAEKAEEVAEKTMAKVREQIGLLMD